MSVPSVKPIVIIEPRRGLGWLDFRELWSYRELLGFLVWRDLKVRYRQTAFGALWAILQPVLLMLIFTLVLGRVNGVSPPGVPYPIFTFAALVPWTVFAQSLLGSSNSLVESANLLQKVYFPRLLIPVAAVGSYVLDYAIAMVVLIGLMLGSGIVPRATIVAIIPLTVLALAAAVGVGIWLSAVNVRFRDVRYAIPFLVQLWLFASPVAYASTLIPAEWQWLYGLNPMVGIIDGFRWALLGTPVSIAGISLSLAATAIVLITGLAYFRRVERTFADVI